MLGQFYYALIWHVLIKFSQIMMYQCCYGNQTIYFLCIYKFVQTTVLHVFILMAKYPHVNFLKLKTVIKIYIASCSYLNSWLGAVLVQLVHTKATYKQYCYKKTRFGAECTYIKGHYLYLELILYVLCVNDVQFSIVMLQLYQAYKVKQLFIYILTYLQCKHFLIQK